MLVPWRLSHASPTPFRIYSFLPFHRRNTFRVDMMGFNDDFTTQLSKDFTNITPQETTIDDMGVSKNRGTPKSSITNHPFWGSPIFGNTHIDEISVRRHRDDISQTLICKCNHAVLEKLRVGTLR